MFVIEARLSSLITLRKCVIVGGQSKDDETQIWCKVLEYETSHTLQVQGLFNIKDNVQNTPVYPSANADPNDFHQERIREGIRMITERITQAIGQ